MLFDCRGHEVTALSQLAVDQFDNTVSLFLAHSKKTPEALGTTLETDPQLLIALIAKGFFYKMLAKASADPVALESLFKAKLSLRERGATQRESELLKALEDWCSGHLDLSISRLDNLLCKYPLDALTVKLTHACQFIRGQSKAMRSSTTKVLRAWSENDRDYGFILGCHCFGLEETGAYSEAEKIGKQAVELEPDDAWGTHAVGHVLEMSSRPQEGLNWLSQFQDRWDNCNNFSFHMYWHMALFHLELGHKDEVLHLYDNYIRKDHTDDFRDISNGVSLLYRLELEGVDVGHRWEEMARLSATHVNDHSLAFADAHYLLAILGAGNKLAADSFIETMEQKSQGDGTAQAVFRHIGMPLAKAIKASKVGQDGKCVDLLLPVFDQLQQIGGSHAQRDVFHRLLIDAAIRSNRHDTARELLEKRLQDRPDNIWALNRAARIEADFAEI
ncbi:tetratricopeptide repeat protein [Kiloniella laminariae]|uniref:Tetratricopeptide repeat protein 38 n=1 Tax=Kiloniella laminariae TaxID=454162 RepID=A0ABT4LNS4_9PROT|nr:tetratricopeptide repeat protein [Kiloniella laminariae]MCZ4282737.1 tetratricopeptide repeat protein [Kiloniella laminariae]